MIRGIHVHGSAESDLIDIWQYSFEQWGAAQADKYLDELDSGIRKLAINPESGMRRDFVRDGYRVLFVGCHAVYYTVTPDTVHSIRVLHGRMDPDRHLE
ncbi:MAG TPA: type II toxin-antitoxin system RelE/ParE family toxin [Steroidobacteraceae bacterium]|nr:type II toxin-antitoxin system RelE/ParE family toxin [Steroidobacteraceae bacterium]